MKEILVAGNGDEVESLLAGTDPSQAEVIGQAAWKSVLKDHTYKQRASLINSIFTKQEAYT